MIYLIADKELPNFWVEGKTASNNLPWAWGHTWVLLSHVPTLMWPCVFSTLHLLSAPSAACCLGGTLWLQPSQQRVLSLRGNRSNLFVKTSSNQLAGWTVEFSPFQAAWPPVAPRRRQHNTHHTSQVRERQADCFGWAWTLSCIIYYQPRPVCFLQKFFLRSRGLCFQA